MMETKKYKVIMGNPCSYGWQNMTPHKKGRYCAQCNKTVIDFTGMTDEQLISYLLNHKNVCGHFKKSQLNRPIWVYVQKPKIKLNWPAVAVMLVAGMFQLSPVYSQGSVKINPVAATGITSAINKEKKDIDHNVIFDNDSTVIIRIKVIDAGNKKHIIGATIQIESIGEYTSNEKGYFQISICTKNLPGKIRINAWATNYYYYSKDIELSAFIQKPIYHLELWYDDSDMPYDGGDIDVIEVEPGK